MKSTVSTKDPPKNPLYAFAEYIRRKSSLDQIRNPEYLAAELRRYFGIRDNLRKAEFINVLKSKLGINNISPESLPFENRGLFGKFQDNVKIFYRENDWDGSQEFTIGHELREIIGVTFEDIDPAFSDAKGEELENVADAFSAALHMDEMNFTADMTRCGYDPIFLQKLYHKSYIGVAARMASVSNLQTPQGHLWCSVFESESDLQDGYLRAKCFHRSPRYIPIVRYRPPNLMFPRRGMIVKMHENLLTAYHQGEPVYIRKLTGLDFWNKFCLSVIIRPVIWGNEVAKIIVVCVPEEHSYLLLPQLQTLSPIIVEESYQLL